MDTQAKAHPTPGSAEATLSFLLRRMRRQADFPAISAHIAEVNRKTTASDGVSAHEIANVILQDYALSTKLLKLVNSPFYGQYGGRISTVSRAIVVLGYERVRTAALSLMLFEHIGNRPDADALREEAGRAFLSGAIGRKLADDLNVGAEPEEVFVCAMLHGLGRYLTQYYLPEEFTEIERSLGAGNTDEQATSRAVLGLSFEELGLGVAREWQLPPAIVDSMHTVPGGPVSRRAGQPVSHRHLAGFSNELCRVMAEAGPDDGEDALRSLRKRYEGAFPVSRKGVERALGAALDDARSYGAAVKSDLRITATFRKAARWLGVDEKEAAPRASAEAPETRDVPAPPHESVEERHRLLIDGIQDITNAILENSPLNDVLMMVLETAYRGLGFSRTILCILDKRRSVVEARLGLGPCTEALLPRFRFSMEGDDDVFRRAVQQRRDALYPTPGSRACDVPRWHRELLSPSSFVVFHVSVNGVCVGMLYCDVEDGRRRLGADDLNYLNTLRNQAALAIKQQS